MVTGAELVLTQRLWVPATDDTEAQSGSAQPKVTEHVSGRAKAWVQIKDHMIEKILTIGSVMEMKFVHLIINVQESLNTHAV